MILDFFQSNNATSVAVNHIILELAENETKYPKDILSQHSAIHIELHDAHRNSKNISIEIHPEAFRYSRNVTNYFTFDAFEMRNFNWSFLAGFNQLTNISIHYSFNVQISNLPSLPSLIELKIRWSTGLNNMTHFPFLSNGLFGLVIQYCGLNDQAVDRILNWIQNGPSNNTLICIYLSGNALSQIPRQLYSAFTNLTSINLDRQKKPGFGIISDLSFLTPIKTLNLSFCHISDIKPHSFTGFFKNIFLCE